MPLPHDLPGEDLELELTEPMLQEPPSGLTGLVRVGELVTFDAVRHARLGPDELDAQVRMLCDDHDFTLVRLPLTIRPKADAIVRFLAVEVLLDAPDSSAVCWSMDPLRVEDELKLATTAKVDATLTVQLAKLGAGLEDKTEYVVRTPRVVAYNVGAHDPAWEFAPTRTRGLDGVEILQMVVKAPRGVAWSGSVRIRLDVESRGWPWPFRAKRKNGQSSCAEFSRPKDK